MGRPQQDLSHELRFITERGYTKRDLEDLGLTPYLASRALARTELQLPDSGFLEVPLSAGLEIIALVASNDVARTTLEHGVYLRDRSLEKPVRRIATHLGTDNNQRIDAAWPIQARGITADGTTAPTFRDPAAQAIATTAWSQIGDFIAEHWPSPTDVLILGEPIQGLSVPLGYRGNGGLPGTQHHLLSDLLAATQLKGLETV